MYYQATTIWAQTTKSDTVPRPIYQHSDSLLYSNANPKHQCSFCTLLHCTLPRDFKNHQDIIYHPCRFFTIVAFMYAPEISFDSTSKNSSHPHDHKMPDISLVNLHQRLRFELKHSQIIHKYCSKFKYNIHNYLQSQC